MLLVVCYSDACVDANPFIVVNRRRRCHVVVIVVSCWRQGRDLYWRLDSRQWRHWLINCEVEWLQDAPPRHVFVHAVAAIYYIV